MGLKVKIEDTVYWITWFHSPHEFLSGNGSTCCEVFDSPLRGVDPTWIGFAYCSLKDKYSKETGRKLSLAKALAGWPREKRKLVWEAYHSRKASSR